jgi:separase
MRSIPEEEPVDNHLEKSFEILRGSDGEDSASGRTSRARSRRHVF